MELLEIGDVLIEAVFPCRRRAKSFVEAVQGAKKSIKNVPQE